MNNDVSLGSSSRDNNSTAQTPSSDEPNSAQAIDSQPRTRPRRQRRAKKKRLARCPGQEKKLVFLTDLLNSLDLVVFAEISILYYMECSMLRFVLRAFVQYYYLSPKHEASSVALAITHLPVFLVVVPNIICIALHLFTALPVGPKNHGGYQHGGMVIDFIGQLPSTSRTYYLLADVFLFLLQCIMLTVHTEREHMRLVLKTFRPQQANLPTQLSAGRTLQELDQEERGIPDRMMEEAVNHGSDLIIEVGPSNGRRTREINGRGTTHLNDVLSSGNGVLGPYNVLQTIRHTVFNFQRTAAHSLTSMDYNATFAAIRAHAQRRTFANVTTPPVHA